MEQEKSLDPQLWHACAGSMVQIPSVNSTVFYFAQGHAEHTHAPPDFNAPRVPPLILCRIVAVKFLADAESDEVYTKITLLPLPGNDLDLENDAVLGLNPSDGIGNESQEPASFAKTLNQSDVNNGGGFSVPRFCAETIFPRLDYMSSSPVQTVTAKDIHGDIWKFRHIYYGMPRRHLLTTGWSTFVNQKKLIAGELIVFLRSDSGDLCVGFRRSKRGGLGSSVPGSSVRVEAVEEAVACAARGQEFEVVYYPRASTPEFCVKAADVRSAMRIRWCSGMRFKMAYETEDFSSSNWFMGTVSGVQVVDPIRWPDSPWRLLQVAWDEPDLLQKVKQVSPWLVELVSNTFAIPLSPRKKLRIQQPFDGVSAVARDGGDEITKARTMTLHIALRKMLEPLAMFEPWDKVESGKSRSKQQMDVDEELPVAKTWSDAKPSRLTEGSGDSGSGSIIINVAGKPSTIPFNMTSPSYPKDEWYFFCEFLANRLPSLSLSECRAEDVIDFLHMQHASGDADALVGRRSAACEVFGIKPQDNPFHSVAVTAYLKAAKEMTRETACILVFSCNDSHDVDEKHFIKAIIKEMHERDVTPLTYNLSGRDNLDAEMLYRSSVGIMVLSYSYACSRQSLDHLVEIMEHGKALNLVIIPIYFKVTLSDICGLEGRFEAAFLQHLTSSQPGRVQKWKAAMAEITSTDGNEWTKE